MPTNPFVRVTRRSTDFATAKLTDKVSPAVTSPPITVTPTAPVAAAGAAATVNAVNASETVASARETAVTRELVKTIGGASRRGTFTEKKITGGKLGAIGAVTERPPLVVDRPPELAFNQFTKRIVRPRDLMVLEFTFVNLRVNQAADGTQTLTRRVADAPSYIVVGFPPQHVLERAFFETSPETPIVNPPPPHQPVDPDRNTGNETPQTSDLPIASRIADASRLVFRVPADFTSLVYTLTSVLDACQTYEMSVAPTATAPSASRVVFPGAFGNLVDSARKTANVSALKATKTATARTRSLRGAAALAYTATVVAEAQNQWYAKRSPLSRAAAWEAELQRVPGLADKVKLLPQLVPPDATQTAIEAPTRLILSPNPYAAWVHADQPVESAKTGRVELWHTRLAVRGAEGVTEAAHFLRTVRAIWSPDVIADDPFAYTEHPDPVPPFRAAMDQFDRHNIVHLSANPRIPLAGSRTKRFTPLPIDVDRLMLTSLGAWLNVRGAWNPPPPLSVEEWRHRATMGRDHYVRIVYAGALYPFGHRASLIKVTERKFQPGVKGNAAMLRQRMFIVVREPYRLLGHTGLFNDESESLDRKMPIKAARITTLVTPNIDDPKLKKCAVVDPEAALNLKGQSLFWPHVGGSPFLFHLQFEDETGALIDAAMPLIFLGNEQLDKTTRLIPADPGETIAGNYSTYPGFGDRRRTALNGQRVQLAPAAKPGDTSFELAAIEFCLAFKNGLLIPGVASAAAAIPAMKHLARSQTVPPEVKFPSLYLQSGLPQKASDPNPGQVFLELVKPASATLNLSGQADRAGALLAPNIALTGISRTIGPVGGDLAKIAAGGFDPNEFFKDLGSLMPKLFGCIEITKILDAVGLADLTKVPRFISENLTAAQALLDDLQRIQLLLTTLENQLPGLKAQATALAGTAATVISRISALLTDPLNAAKQSSFTDGFQDLSAAATTLRGGFGGLTVPEPVQFAKIQLDQLLAKFTVGLEKAADVAKLATNIVQTLEAINEQRIKFQWSPTLKSWPSSDPIFEVRSPADSLTISVELAAQSGTSKEPSFDIACRLQKFDLNLMGKETFLKLHFNKIEFIASSRKKPDVNVDFGGLEFVGVLSFVETLRSLIPLDGFSDPPSLTVSEQGIEAKFSLGLPTIAIGVFSLQNLSLGAALTVPFLGQQPLSVRFNFCERSDPFRLTVWVFGGGGFFAVTVTPARVQVLEAAFEFGACVALDFGVASGSVSVMAGIYYRIEADDASLTGYFNLKGRVSVLGLITASLELSLELTYEFASGKCVGRASLVIEVEVLFFSTSVTVTCEKRLAGANGDPTFAQIMAPYADPVSGATVDPWADYCEAFAA